METKAFLFPQKNISVTHKLGLCNIWQSSSTSQLILEVYGPFSTLEEAALLLHVVSKKRKT